MKFKAIIGKNFKNFVYIQDIKTKQDFELYEVVKKILTRSEYFPFMQGFNKTQTYTYLFNDYVFPIQFWNDVKKQVLQFDPTIELEDEHLLYQNSIDRDDFDEYISTLKFPEEISTTDEDYQYQRDSVFLALQNKIGRIEVATSGGKTFITYLYCRYIIDHNLVGDRKILVVVPSKTLCLQLKSDFKEYDVLMKRKLTVENIFSGAKKLLEADIVAGTFQSLGDYDKDYYSEFGVLICDELHRAKSYTIRNEIFAKMLNCEYFFGMTGTTPAYKTLDYLHIVSMFGSEMVKRTAKQNIDSGVSTPIHITAIKIDYDEDKNYSENLITEGIVGIEKYRLEKEYFHSNENRTRLIGKLMNNFTENSLILVDTIEYCFILKEFLEKYCTDWQFHIIYGETVNREELIENMRVAKSHYCIVATYGTMSTGVSIKNIANIYFPDGGKSEIRIRQSLGRGMRVHPSKEFCRVFDFQDNMPRCAFKNHAKARNNVYREQEFPVKTTRVTI